MSDEDGLLPPITIKLGKDVTEEDAVKAATCPDCTATLTVFGPDEHGHYDVLRLHDDTCPTYLKRMDEEGL